MASVTTAGNLGVGDVLDAVPDHAEPGEDAVVLADVRGEFPVEASALREFEVLLLELLADRQGAVVERQEGVGAQNAAVGGLSSRSSLIRLS